MKWSAPTALFLTFIGGAAAQTPAPKNQDPLNRDTPQSTVASFLNACHSKNYARAWRYLDLRGLPEDKRSHDGPLLAQQLVRVLDRDARFDVGSLSRDREGDTHDGLPADRELVDTYSIDGHAVPLRLERTTLRSGLEVWWFAPESVAFISKLAVRTSDSPIEKHLPPILVNWKLIDTSLWRWIAMGLLLFVLAALSLWISRFALYIAYLIFKRTVPGIDRQVLHTFAAPLQLLLPVVMFRAALPGLGLSGVLQFVVQRTLALLLFMSIAWLCVRIVDACILAARAILVARHSTVSYSALSLASRIFKLTILVFAVTAVLSAWGYNTSAILAGLGVGGIAVALAAQKTIENLFGGVAVISDRPVAVGDYCKFDDRAGTVEDIGLRSTRIRTIDRTLVTVPNGSFSAMTLENFARRDKMLFHITLNLRRDTTPEQVRTVLESVGRKLMGHSKVEAGATPIRFIGIGAYSLDLEVFVYVLTKDGDEFLKIQQDLLLTILDEVSAAGTALALPTQASVIYSIAEQEVGTHGASSPNGRLN